MSYFLYALDICWTSTEFYLSMVFIPRQKTGKKKLFVTKAQSESMPFTNQMVIICEKAI